MAATKKRKAKTSGKKPDLELALDAEKQADFEDKIKQIKKNVGKNITDSEDDNKGVVFLKHIPHGFFEPQMKKFFSQFGKVTRLRLSRSKRSGNSKGYAYIEFQYEEVAKIVAETMNNYLMYHKLLKCEFIPKERVWPDLFKGSDRKFKKPIAHRLSLERHNALVKDPKRMKNTTRKLLNKQRRTKNRLKNRGIEWEFHGYAEKAISKDEQTKPAAEEGDEAEETDVTTPKRQKRKSTSKGSSVEEVTIATADTTGISETKETVVKESESEESETVATPASKKSAKKMSTPKSKLGSEQIATVSTSQKRKRRRVKE
ncbi:MKI67 FHA domain-interacting nucleolar phosphoprotein-like [Ptychodera flava]|uniref:MKI67 FHA domain-interacting nucleolar phosphoprotein-like n=1 Tax=Ptychodera flava TaxID=63121 RepID=UPI00396A0524